MRILAALYLALLTLPVFANDPLPAKEVFIPAVSQTHDNGQFRTTVRIAMPENYYLYVDKSDLRSEGITGTLEKSPGISQQDDYFGVQEVWYDEGILTLVHDAPADTFILSAQGCEKNRLCYPPTQWTLHPEVAAAAAVSSNSIFPAARQQPPLLRDTENVLPAEQAFPVHAISDNGQALVLVDMPDGYYLYRDKFTATINGRALLPLFPEGETHTDEFFGEQIVYRGSVRIPLPLAAGDSGQSVIIGLQGCADAGVCYPPMTHTLTFGDLAPAADTVATQVEDGASTRPVATPDTPSSTVHPIQRALGEHFWRNLPLVFLLGISVSFTACVYPLIPIVTSLVVGEHSSTRRSLALVGTYVLGMASAMALVGALFGLLDINVQLILQKPLFVIIAALIFVMLALPLFDLYTLRTPRWLHQPVDRLSRRQASGSYLGAAVTGALSVLVVSACATPVLAALLLFTAQTSMAKSALALFVFGLGTGVPLFLFASVLRRFLPKAGHWMEAIKRAFAFALLAIALWLITRILPLAATLALWSVWGVLLASYLFPWQAPQHSKILFVRRFAALLAFLFALALANQAVQHYIAPPTATDNGAYHAKFTYIDDLAALEQALARSNQPVIVDIYADWCVSCKTWERDIWHNPTMAESLAGHTLLKVDVTDFSTAHQALFRRLNIIAPPTVLLYRQGEAMDTPARLIVGEMRAAEFARELEKWR